MARPTSSCANGSTTGNKAGQNDQPPARTSGNRHHFSYDNYELKWGRKLLHISSSWIGFVYMYSGISHHDFILALSIAVITFLLFDLARLWDTWFSRLAHRLFDVFFIQRDVKRLNSATWYLIAILLGGFLFGGDTPLQRLFVGLPILYLALGDTAASIIGKLLEGPRLPAGQGTWWGSFACFVVCLLINIAFMLWALPTRMNLALAAGAAAVATVGEALPIPYVDDNVPIVVLSGLFLFLTLQ